MASVFDGMAGVLAETLGAPVLFLPQVGQSREVLSIFRETPVEATGDDGGAIIINMPTWRVRKSDAVAVRGDQIEVSGGRRYVVVASYISGSPADDAFVIYKLEVV